jgi:hypothetical protein
MLKVKSLMVFGDTVTRNGVKEKDLANKVDRAINDILAGLEGELVDVKINTQIVGASAGDNAFVTLIYRAEEQAQRHPVEEKKKSK